MKLIYICSYFTKRPHVGGGEQNRKLGEYVRDEWKSYKFDHVEMVQYDVLLSMPPRDKPNAVKIINTTDGTVLWNVEGPEKVIPPARFDFHFSVPFCAGWIPGGLLPINECTERLRPKGVSFSGFWNMKVGIWLVELYERVAKNVFRSVKRLNKAYSCFICLWKSRENVPVYLWFIPYFKDSECIYSIQKGCRVVQFVHRRYTKRLPFPRQKWFIKG